MPKTADQKQEQANPARDRAHNAQAFVLAVEESAYDQPPIPQKYHHHSDQVDDLIQLNRHANVDEGSGRGCQRHSAKTFSPVPPGSPPARGIPPDKKSPARKGRAMRVRDLFDRAARLRRHSPWVVGPDVHFVGCLRLTRYSRERRLSLRSSLLITWSMDL